MSVAILSYDAQYAPLFDQLNRAWIEEYFSIEPLDELVLTQPEEMILATGGEIWFAALGADVVGACALLPHKEGMFEFTKLGVSERARGHGVAKALLRHSAVRAKERGAHTLRIFTSTKLLPACSLYRAEGFSEVAMSAEERARYIRGDIMFDLKLG